MNEIFQYLSEETQHKILSLIEEDIIDANKKNEFDSIESYQNTVKLLKDLALDAYKDYKFKL